MAKWIVEGKELWVTTYVVEAETEEEAKQCVKDGDTLSYRMDFLDFLGFEKVEKKSQCCKENCDICEKAEMLSNGTL